MPDIAVLRGDVACPACNTVLLQSARFQWGAVPRAEYRIGDSVLWLEDENGVVVPPFKLVSTGSGQWRWNCGEAKFRNVILFDADVYASNHVLKCEQCRESIAAIVTNVWGGRFSSLLALRDGELETVLGSSRNRASIVIIREDGTYWPREDWDDPAIEYTTPIQGDQARP